jgi:hypothetical protein
MGSSLSGPKKRLRKYPAHLGKSGDLVQLRKIIQISLSLLGDNHLSMLIVGGLDFNITEYPGNWDSDTLKLVKLFLETRLEERGTNVSKKNRKLIDKAMIHLIRNIDYFLSLRSR